MFYEPNDLATITESYMYICIHEGMHVLFVTQECICGLDIVSGGGGPLSQVSGLRETKHVSITCYTIQLMHYSHFKTQSLQHLKLIKC
jgi:hypothetical protein